MPGCGTKAPLLLARTSLIAAHMDSDVAVCHVYICMALLQGNASDKPCNHLYEYYVVRRRLIHSSRPPCFR